jgi:Fe-S-cluster containining protein
LAVRDSIVMGLWEMSIAKLLKFRCTGCGNCCKEPLLPLTDEDLMRLVSHTGSDPLKLVKFITRDEIDMDHEPEGFASLRQGKRVMVLRHERGRCIYLGSDDRCTVYAERPLGCRVFPLDPTFSRSGKLVRLQLIQATECPYELDGHNSLRALAALNQSYDLAMLRYRAKIADWNRLQRRRKRQGQPAQTARAFLAFLGVVAPAKPAQASGRATDR